MYKFKLLLLLTFALLSTLAQADTMTADQIMKRVDERYTGDTNLSKAQLILIDKRDRRRTRHLQLFGIEKSEVEKSLIFFMSPSDVKGTAYMSFDWQAENKEDDSWLYLPAMQRIQRVADSEESGFFMGSDFSYADINGLDYEDFDYELLVDSEMVDGHDCWVIQSTSKNADIIKKTGYTSSKSWVRKDIFFTVKSIINVKKGKRIKYFAAKDLEEIQGIWTAKTLQMVSTHKGKKEHSSVFKITDIVYNDQVDESMFDTQVMQRGI